MSDCPWAWQAAAEVAGTPTAKHSFTTIQLPANLVEQEGLKGRQTSP